MTHEENKTRKELVRLRLEMQRQQLRYNAQPLTNPLGQVKALWAHRQAHKTESAKEPLVILTTLALAVFGRRLGKLGTLARLGLILYPLIKGLRAIQPPQKLPPPRRLQ